MKRGYKLVTSLLKVAAIQIDTQNNKVDNLKKTEELIRQAAREGAQLVALPEYFNFLGTSEEERLNAESIHGKTSVFFERSC